jgi:MFS family permease
MLRQLGISDFGIFFIIVGTTSLLARPLLGRLSDRIGRDLSIATGFGLQILGLLVMTTASSLAGMIGCGMLYMLGNAIGSSTTLALALERADPLRRGKQMATFSIAYPLSYGVGFSHHRQYHRICGYTGMFLAMAGSARLRVDLRFGSSTKPSVAYGLSKCPAQMSNRSGHALSHCSVWPNFSVMRSILSCSRLSLSTLPISAVRRFIVGLVIASFGVTSVISRPIIGYWADRWSVTGVMILGLFTQTFANLICFIPYSGATMLANGVRGSVGPA